MYKSETPHERTGKLKIIFKIMANITSMVFKNGEMTCNGRYEVYISTNKSFLK